MRHSHFLNHNKAVQQPRNCIFFDTETTSTKINRSQSEAKLWFGWACFTDSAMREEWIRFENGFRFWTWAVSKVQSKERLYVYAHNMAFDATVTDAINALQHHGYTLNPKLIIIDDPPTFIGFENGDKSIVLVDTFNYFNLKLDTLGESIGIAKLTMPSLRNTKPFNTDKAAAEWRSSENRLEWDRYCKRDVSVIKLAMQKLFAFVRDHDLGNFAFTQAAQSLNAYRHRFMDFPIFIDDNIPALELSRSAYYGGRVEAFRLGRIKGRVYKLDVNSMYPYVMRYGLFPTQIAAMVTDPSVDELETILKDFSVVARVTIETDMPYYPILQKGKLIFPIGKFQANLASPELKIALAYGHVKQVHTLAAYRHFQIFNKYVDYFYHLRLQAKKDGNADQAYLFKIFMNSLYGKFGQNGRKWESEGQAEDYDLKTWQEVDADTDEITRFRQIGHVIQKKGKASESANSHPAIAAHVTSYARAYLLRLIESAGWDHVYYCDTDSIFCDEIGKDRLKEYMDDSELGMLKIEESSEAVTIYGLKDYKFGKHIKRKGIRAKAKSLGNDTFRQDSFTHWAGIVRGGNANRMIISKVTKHLNRDYNKGNVTRSGKVTPFKLAG